MALTLLGYQGIWQSTDQIPERAINSGRIDRFGNADPSNGGDSQRYSGQFEWQQRDAERTTRLQLYAAWKPRSWLTLDTEVAITKARFPESPGEDHIPDSVPWMVSRDHGG